MVSGLAATRLLATLVPSMMKMEVAPVSAMAWLGAIVTALMTAGEIARNDACVVESRDNFFGGECVTYLMSRLLQYHCHQLIAMEYF